MEESSNGKIEETQKVEAEGKDNKVVIDYVEEPKAEIESVREVVIDENSGSGKESQYGIDPSSQSSNGKIKEPQNVELEEKDDKVVIDFVGEPKTELDSVTEIVIGENSTSLKESGDGIDPNSDTRKTPEEEGGGKEESSLVNDLGLSEKEEEKEIINSIVDSVEPIVAPLPEVSSTVEASIEKSVDSDVTEVESEGIGQTNEDGPVLADGLLNGKKETISPPTSDEPDEVVSEVVSSTTEEIKLPSSDDKDGLSASAADNVSKGIEETVLPPDVVKRGIEDREVAAPYTTGESSGIVVKEIVENVNDFFKPSTNATIVGSNDAFPESTGNPHVISISQRTLQPTSWRSCCGLFEVLRRSSR